ncbi:MAG: DsbA family protein [Gammaproteobacteria bacterium]
MNPLSQSAVLYYIYDPMCSWCWGFRPVWDQVRAAMARRVEIVYVLGGLAPETDEPMPQAMRDHLQQTWQRIHALCGVPFNFEFWTRNTPRRSTYPACKAALVAREYGKELAMYERIQRFYYLEAGNPSLYENLYALAEELAIPRQEFIDRIRSPELNKLFLEELMLAERLGAQGYPSVVLRLGDQLHFIEHSYTDVQANIAQIEAYLPAG